MRAPEANDRSINAAMNPQQKIAPHGRMVSIA
jgi:hypothetical protein